MATGLLERPSVEDRCADAALGAGLEAREVSATLRSLRRRDPRLRISR
jgi:hypothetical protein